MVDALQKKFVVEHGLKLSSPARFSLTPPRQEIDRLKQWCDTHLNTTFQLMRHDKQRVTERFFKEVTHQAFRAFENTNRDAESWLKLLIAPIETQIRERQIQLTHRLESIKRVLHATGTLDERLNELMHAECQLLDELRGVEKTGKTVRGILAETALREPEREKESRPRPSSLAA
jgi:hypothetical protein